MTDRDWIALTLFGEDRGGSTAGRLAVADVIRNRVKSGRWGHTFESVCCAPKQFSCWNATDPNLVKLRAIIERVESGDGWADPILAECYWIADGFIEDVVLPQFHHSPTHYYASTIKQPPSWAKSGEFVGERDGHLFFARVA